jgi:predicted nucleotidyltransferase
MRRVRSFGSVKSISLERDAVVSALSEVASAMKKACPEVEEVRLVGSLARGDLTGTSDADVLVVPRESPLNPVERIRRYLPFFELDIPVDIIPLTRRELGPADAGGMSRFSALLAGSELLA